MDALHLTSIARECVNTLLHNMLDLSDLCLNRKHGKRVRFDLVPVFSKSIICTYTKDHNGHFNQSGLARDQGTEYKLLRQLNQ